jgi:plastocyanin
LALVGRLLPAASLCLACTQTVPPRLFYQPTTRDFTITTVPLLVQELARTYPFLSKDFARGGVLEGKEVYAFEPSTLTVYAGDTLLLTFINPEDDVHSFVLPDLAVNIPAQSITHATYVARKIGLFAFRCAIPSHLPMMVGQLVVLEPPSEQARNRRPPAP